jgi:8-oxo-dGTP pyrophosphatase MutT (NUDIX family)
MKTSAGVIIINSKNQILGCKPYGTSGTRLVNNLDIPKGHIEEYEMPIQAAIRETLEETGIDLSTSKLEDFGLFPYLRDKNLHLFKCVNFDADITQLVCTSYFESYGREVPEIIAYEWVEMEEVATKFYKSLFPLIQKCL